MGHQFTAEELNSLDHQTLVTLFLGLQDQLNTLSRNIELLTEQVNVLTSKRFGRSSEKLSGTEGQLSLEEVNGELVIVFNEIEYEADRDEESCQDASAAPRVSRRHKGQREESLLGLPVTVIEHDIPKEELEAKLGSHYRRLPDEVYKRLIYSPAKIGVEEHHVAVYAGRNDEMLKAERPKDLIRNSLVTPSLEAAILNAKYVNGVPLYRLEKEFERNGVSLNRQNFCNWTIACCENHLGVMYDFLHRKMYDHHVLHADETTVEVTKDGRPAGSKSYMWVYRTGGPDHPIILYEYQKTRRSDHPREFLREFHGVCITDGYEVYHSLEREREDLTIAGCWAHARRRFSEAMKALPKKEQHKCLAQKALLMIQAIYKADQSLAELTSEDRVIQRQSMVKPLVDAYFCWIRENKTKVLPRSKTDKGFDYSLKQEKYLRTFLEYGDVPLDNNAAESAIRSFCIGRKNWVLVDTIRGAHASAIAYSIAETAKANDLKPYDYFEYLLTEIPKHADETDRSFLEKLLPWSKELPEHIRKPKK